MSNDRENSCFKSHFSIIVYVITDITFLVIFNKEETDYICNIFCIFQRAIESRNLLFKALLLLVKEYMQAFSLIHWDVFRQKWICIFVHYFSWQKFFYLNHSFFSKTKMPQASEDTRGKCVICYSIWMILMF